MASRCILILLDGLGDRAYPELGGRTPLSAAKTPNLDALAAMGACGLMHAERPGLALPSENAHFAMFGYERDEFPGRGYLEALGAGIEPRPDEVALLAHFVSVREKDGVLVLHESRPQATAGEADFFAGLVKIFTGGSSVVRYEQTRHLDGIVLLDEEVSPFITDTDPLEAGKPLLETMPYRVMADDAKARHTALELKKYLVWCYDILRDHPRNLKRIKRGLAPLNALVTQRAGQQRIVQPFSSRWGLQGLSIASGLVYWGLGRFIGMDVQAVTDSDDSGRDLAERLRIALACGNRYDFIHVHTKAPDAAAHAKDPRRKKAVIEELDRGIGEVLEYVDGDTVFVVTADHSTPSAGPQVHSGEPVPVMFVGPGMRRDLVKRFDEVHCAAGALGSLRGSDFMPMVLNCLDRAKLQGLMDTPDDQAYWPGHRKPFRL